MKESKIFVITHKKIFYKIKEDYVPVQVGNNSLDEKYLKDNTGDNISDKNSNYCELTALYWLWKNYELPDYVGICHYRRFFVKRPFYKLIDQKYINKQLENYDVILPYHFKTKSTVKDHFINSPSGRKEDIERLENLIKLKYSEYYQDYINVMSAKSSSYFNMMILSKELFNEYCEWLFDILFEYEKSTNLTGYTKQEARIYGFLSEFLLNVWIKHKNLKIRYCNVLKVEEKSYINFLKKGKLLLKDFFRIIKK